MKYTSKIIASAALLASLAACSQKVEYHTSSFVLVDENSISVSESAGEVKLGITAYPMDGKPNTEVSFALIDGTAKEGVNYTVEPANGILQISQDSTAYITIKPVDFDGEYTGDLKFTIKVTDVSNGYTIGALYETAVTIKDDDHPLANILGTYEVTTYYYYNGSINIARYEMDLNPVDGDVTSVACTGINKMASDFNNAAGRFDVIGSVSEDMKTITFVPQPVQFTTGYGELWLYSTDYVNESLTATGYYLYDDEDIVYTSEEEGVFVSEQGAGFVDDYVWPSYGGFGVGKRTGDFIGADLRTVWTKK